VDVALPIAGTLSATSVAASTYDEWDALTAYLAGERVVVTTAVPHYEYEATQANTGKPPAENIPTYWSRLGATNQYRMLDDRTSSQTVDADAIVVSLVPADKADRVSAYRLADVEVMRVRVYRDAVLEYEAQVGLREWVPALTWSRYFFGDFGFRRSGTIDIPVAGDGTEVEVAFLGSAGATVGVGHLALGQRYRLGRTILPVRDGITDYSVVEEDEWGETMLVPRDYAERLDCEVLIRDGTRAAVKRLLANLRATPCAWDANDDGSDDDGYRVWGYLRDFEFDRDEVTVLRLEIGGLT
jgi:hypothetical protein